MTTRHIRAGVLATVLMLGTITACSDDSSTSDENPDATLTSVQVSTEESSTEFSSSEETTATISSPEPDQPQPQPAPVTNDAQQHGIVGFTEAPGAAEPSIMDKVIDHCGDPAIHERGTTFFTDGTTGWTQECSDTMVIAPAVQPAMQAPQPATDTTFFPSCKAARAAGAAPLYRGDPGYSAKLDRDRDGVACE